MRVNEIKDEMLSLFPEVAQGDIVTIEVEGNMMATSAYEYTARIQGHQQGPAIMVGGGFHYETKREVLRMESLARELIGERIEKVTAYDEGIMSHFRAKVLVTKDSIAINWIAYEPVTVKREVV